MTLPTLPVFSAGVPPEVVAQQHDNASKLDPSRWP